MSPIQLKSCLWHAQDPLPVCENGRDLAVELGPCSVLAASASPPPPVHCRVCHTNGNQHADLFGAQQWVFKWPSNPTQQSARDHRTLHMPCLLRPRGPGRQNPAFQ